MELQTYICRLITYWPARSMLTHFRRRRNSRRASPVKLILPSSFMVRWRVRYYHARMARRAQHLRCYMREANERTTGWISSISLLQSGQDNFPLSNRISATLTKAEPFPCLGAGQVLRWRLQTERGRFYKNWSIKLSMCW